MKAGRKITATTFFWVLAATGVGGVSKAALGTPDAQDPQSLGAIDTKLFNLADLNKDGKISRAELAVSADIIFVSADANGDGVLTEDEFQKWDSGYLSLAQKTGRVGEFSKAKDEAFRQRDLNGDGKIEHDEYSISALYDFYKADVNHDGVLNFDEFVNDYRFLKTIRAAFK